MFSSTRKAKPRRTRPAAPVTKRVSDASARQRCVRVATCRVAGRGAPWRGMARGTARRGVVRRLALGDWRVVRGAWRVARGSWRVARGVWRLEWHGMAWYGMIWLCHAVPCRQCHWVRCMAWCGTPSRCIASYIGEAAIPHKNTTRMEGHMCSFHVFPVETKGGTRRGRI